MEILLFSASLSALAFAGSQVYRALNSKSRINESSRGLPMKH